MEAPSHGSTRDMSTRGAYIVSDNAPSLAAGLDIVWFLPAPDAPRHLHAAARVLRVEPIEGSSGSTGFAVRFETEVELGSDKHDSD